MSDMAHKQSINIDVEGNHYHLRSGNGSLLMTSREYGSEEQARAAARRTVAAIVEAPVELTYIDHSKRSQPILKRVKIR